MTRFPCCSRCGLTENNCICGCLPVLNSQCQFWLLTHANEFSKDTNTGRLVKAILPETEVVAWSRVEPSERLLGLLSDSEIKTCLVFPEQYAIYQQEAAERTTASGSDCRKAFIIIDSTWQQARKIYRQSPYLHGLPLLKLLPEQSSSYTLRRNQQPGHLCTAEVVAEVLRTRGEGGIPAAIDEALVQFCNGYKAGK
ncbi:MAG: tRNA-uridine aminocarboxypropyltransferase [Endozoicomonas sp.]